MRTLILAITLLGGAGWASADIVAYYGDAGAAASGFVRAGLDEPPSPAGPGVVTIYDNYTPPAEGGRTLLGGVYASEDHVIQDDIVATAAESRLSAYYLLFSNRSSTSRLSRFTYSIEFVGPDGGAFGYHYLTVDLSIFPLPENSTGVLRFGDGAFTGLNIILPQQFDVRQRLYDPVGISPEQLGVPYGGPRTLGASGTGFWNLTTGTFVDLPEPYSLMFLIRANVIPSPAGLSLVLAAAPLLSRPRRGGDRGIRPDGVDRPAERGALGAAGGNRPRVRQVAGPEVRRLA